MLSFLPKNLSFVKFKVLIIVYVTQKSPIEDGDFLHINLTSLKGRKIRKNV